MRGKEVRLSRILDKGKALIIPMDHGLTIGPVKGIMNMKNTIQKVVNGYVIIMEYPGLYFVILRKAGTIKIW